MQYDGRQVLICFEVKIEGLGYRRVRLSRYQINHFPPPALIHARPTPHRIRTLHHPFHRKTSKRRL